MDDFTNLMNNLKSVNSQVRLQGILFLIFQLSKLLTHL